jgi:spore germination protein YaaH
MAYDEHYGGGPPGPIASIDWCKKVVDYSLKNISEEKLVMGLPFYGRAWASVNPAKAYKHSTIAKMLKDKRVGETKVVRGVPYFKYQEVVDVTVYFENSLSIMNKAKTYYESGARKIAFWRLGQEDIAIWETL